MGDKIELVFDQLQNILDEKDFGSWSESDARKLFSLLDAYYKYQHKQEIQKQKLQRIENQINKEEGEETNNNIIVINDDDDIIIAEVDRSLTKLRRFLQQRVPYGSISEPNTPSFISLSENNNNNNNKLENNKIQPPVYPVDSFLYLEEDIEELVERKCISREYCCDCGSVNIGLSDFITHSFSQDQLIFLSCYLLPALSGNHYSITSDWKLKYCNEENNNNNISKINLPFNCRHIVDVGSRLGVVLLSCYFAAQQKCLISTEKITGIEIDNKLITIQQDAIKRFASKQTTTVQLDIIHSDCFKGIGEETLRGADVIILHNVFEYFCDSIKDHMKCWQRLRENITRKGQLLICSPSLDETFANFDENDARTIFNNNNNNQSSLKDNSRKRHRSKEEEEEEKEEFMKHWCQLWVEEIDITEVRDNFLKQRQVCNSCHDDNDNNSCNSSCNNEVDEELEEKLRSISVYVVK